MEIRIKDTERLKQLVADGHSVASIAGEFDVSRMSVARALKRNNIADVTDGRQSVTTLRKAVEDMKPSEAVEYLLEVIEEFTPSEDAEKVMKIMSLLPVTQLEAKLLLILATRRGNPVSKNQIMNVLYAHRVSGEVPDEKIVDVKIHSLRKKLNLNITTIWGIGFMIAADSIFPWES